MSAKRPLTHAAALSGAVWSTASSKRLLRMKWTSASFHYKSGVYNGCSPPANMSRKVAGYHAVKIVGWGTTDIDPSLDYWTVQNSWGAGVRAQLHDRTCSTRCID